jgi:hypothetical protein
VRVCGGGEGVCLSHTLPSSRVYRCACNIAAWRESTASCLRQQPFAHKRCTHRQTCTPVAAPFFWPAPLALRFSIMCVCEAARDTH